ncbi:MAG: hypothetical protein ABI076_02320, partial [Acidobacteriaceae bacterium]
MTLAGTRAVRCLLENFRLGFCLLVFLVGCGSGAPSGLTSTPPAPPNPAAPSQPPPAPVQMGSVTISPQNVAVAPGQALHFSATGGGAIEWLVNGVVNGNASVGAIDSSGNYTAPSTVSQSKNIVVEAALTSAPSANYASATVAVIQSGVVTSTTNPLVAEYSIYLPRPGSMAVQFGPDTSYGR